MTAPILEKMTRPPIVEVACGISFDPVAELDMVTIGGYWQQRRADYPVHQILPAVTAIDEEQFVLFSQMPQLRAWLVSSDETSVLQIQSNRFYVNWRARGVAYPRFADHDGKRGLLARTLDEFKQFTRYCAETLGAQLRPKKVDLMKIDHFVQQRHWTDFNDLARCIPWLGTLAEFSKSGGVPNVALQLAEQRSGGRLVVSVNITNVLDRERGESALALAMESRIISGAEGGLHEAFVLANDELNQVFAAMIPVEERAKRFGGQSR